VLHFAKALGRLWKMADLSPISLRHKRFARAYVANGYNAAKAYMTVYQEATEQSANTNAYKLLALPEVKAHIAEREAELGSLETLDSDRILSEIAKLAYQPKANMVKLGALQLASKIKGLERQEAAPTGAVVFQIVQSPSDVVTVIDTTKEE
jgi:phage terminase small subunit